MDNMGIIMKLPTMLSGWNLDAAMEILPDYDPEIIYESDAATVDYLELMTNNDYN